MRALALRSNRFLRGASGAVPSWLNSRASVLAINWPKNQGWNENLIKPVLSVNADTRQGPAYVLDGSGSYVIRAANEPAYAQGHGLDGFAQEDNLLTAGNDFTNAAWIGGASVVSNVAIAPDGTLTADKITLRTDSPRNPDFKQTFACVGSADHTSFLAVKAASASQIGKTARVILIRANGDFVAQSAEVMLTGGWQYVPIALTTAANNTQLSLGLSWLSSSDASELCVWRAHVIKSDVHFPPIPDGGTRYADNSGSVQATEGPELVVNGNFGTSVTGWTASGSPTTFDSYLGRARYVTSETGVKGFYGDETVEPGKSVRLTVDLEAVETPTFVQVYDAAGFTSSFGSKSISAGNTGTLTFDIVPSGATVRVYTYTNAGGTRTFYVDNISCKRLTPIQGWLAAGYDNGFTSVGNFYVPYLSANATRILWAAGADSTNYVRLQLSTSNILALVVVVGGSAVLSKFIATLDQTGWYGFAARIKSGDFRVDIIEPDATVLSPVTDATAVTFPAYAEIKFARGFASSTNMNASPALGYIEFAPIVSNAQQAAYALKAFNEAPA